MILVDRHAVTHATQEVLIASLVEKLGYLIFNYSDQWSNYDHNRASSL